MIRRSRLSSLALLLALVLPTAVAAAHHEKAEQAATAWDDEAVTSRLVKLTQQTVKLQDGIAKHLEEAEEGSPHRLVLHDIYDIHRRAISLQTGVRAGLGRDGTEPVFRRLLGSVRDARKDAQRYPEVEELRSHIDEANAILDDLERYYGISE